LGERGTDLGAERRDEPVLREQDLVKHLQAVGGGEGRQGNRRSKRGQQMERVTPQSTAPNRTDTLVPLRRSARKRLVLI
jgi:hypothetical protein